MSNIGLVPRPLLKLLLPSRAAGAIESVQGWEGGTVRARSTGGQLATKSDLALVEAGWPEGDVLILRSSKGLSKAGVQRGLERCVRTVLTIEVSGRTESFPLVMAYRQAESRFEIQVHSEIVPLIEILTAV